MEETGLIEGWREVFDAVEFLAEHTEHGGDLWSRAFGCLVEHLESVGFARADAERFADWLEDRKRRERDAA